MNTQSSALRYQDLINNPIQRLPLCICIDVSESMRGELIEELNTGLIRLFEGISSDETTKYSVEIAIITFGGKAEYVRDFATTALNPYLPELCAGGRPLMGEAITLAVEMINTRLAEYKKRGVDFQKPWLMIISGSSPVQNDELKKAKEITKRMIKEKKLFSYPIGIGDNADMDELNNFKSFIEAQKYSVVDLERFFRWASASTASGSVRITDNY